MNVVDFLALHAHVEDVARELMLIEVGGHLGHDIPIHISTLTEALTRGLTGLRNESRRQAMAAMEAGHDEVCLQLDLPIAPEALVRAVIDLLDQTDLCSRRGVLLAPVAPPGARRVLQVVLDHVEAPRRPDRLAPGEASVATTE